MKRGQLLLIACSACLCLAPFIPFLEGPASRIVHDPAHENVTTLVTALYDIHRRDRPFDQYLPWFERTLQFPFRMVIFCKERRVADLAWAVRRGLGLSELTTVVLEDDYPLKHLAPAVASLLDAHKEETSRWSPERNNGDYILLQYSKFQWLLEAMRMQGRLGEKQVFFWVDAGISRFLTRGQTSLRFQTMASNNSMSVQTVFQSEADLPSHEEFAKCIGCSQNLFKAGIFGGTEDVMRWVSREMLKILTTEMIATKLHRIGNEQQAFALLYSRYPKKFRLLFPEADFGSGDCNFICL